VRSVGWLLVATIGAESCASQPPQPPQAPQAPQAPPAPALFRFHVDFWANLDEVLLHEALVPRPGFDGPKSLKQRHVVMAETLSPPEAARWRDALAYYDTHFTTHNLFDRFIGVMPVFLGADASTPPAATSAFDEEWRAQLLAAAPIYREHFWPDHERTDRAYIEGMQPLVAAHGAWFAKRLVAVYGMPLPKDPIDVDVVPAVPPFGGFTQGEPPYQGANAALITLSSVDASYAGDSGVEMLFHEVSHLIVGRVQEALEASAKRQGRKVPPRLWHDVIFYTAGHLAQERLGPSYVPFAERPSSHLFDGASDPTVIALKRSWQPYLDGHVTMDAAIDAVAGSF
jgi:hypothetical protein